MSYATLAEFSTYGGLPATALGTLTTTQQQGQLDAATDEMNTYLAGRYSMPLLVWDNSIKAKCCEIAAYKMICLRGFNPGSGADVNLRMRYLDAVKWCEVVRNKSIHPTVTETAQPSPTLSQPKILTSSMVTTGGATGTTRGW